MFGGDIGMGAIDLPRACSAEPVVTMWLGAASGHREDRYWQWENAMHRARRPDGKMVRRCILAVLVLAGLGASWRCGDSDHKLLLGRPWNGKSTQKGRWTQSQAEAFTLLPLYWLGPSYAGYNLTDIHRTGAQSVFFTYDNCRAGSSGWFDDTGCNLPLTLQVHASCLRRTWVREGEYRRALMREVRRGGRMVVTSPPPVDVHLVFGRVAIEISGASPFDANDVVE